MAILRFWKAFYDWGAIAHLMEKCDIYLLKLSVISLYSVWTSVVFPITFHMIMAQLSRQYLHCVWNTKLNARTVQVAFAIDSYSRAFGSEKNKSQMWKDIPCHVEIKSLTADPIREGVWGGGSYSPGRGYSWRGQSQGVTPVRVAVCVG